MIPRRKIPKLTSKSEFARAGFDFLSFLTIWPTVVLMFLSNIFTCCFFFAFVWNVCCRCCCCCGGAGCVDYILNAGFTCLCVCMFHQTFQWWFTAIRFFMLRIKSVHVSRSQLAYSNWCVFYIKYRFVVDVVFVGHFFDISTILPQ